MVEQRLMTDKETWEVLSQVIELEKQGKKEKAAELHKQIPVPAFLAKLTKEVFGLKQLLSLGLNLAEAEAEYGPEFFTDQNHL